MAWTRVAEVRGEGLGCRGAVTAAGQEPSACEASRCPSWASGKAASAPGRRGTYAHLAVLAVPQMCCGSMRSGSLQSGICAVWAIDRP
jgi:hypothetical protein